MLRSFGTATALVIIAGATAAQTCPQDYDFIAPVGQEQGMANITSLRAGLQAGGQRDFDAFMAIAADPYIQHSPDLPDGWEPVWDLMTNRAPDFSSTMITWVGPQGFMVNGDYLVMFREVDHGDGNGPEKKFDLMYFDEDGLYAEHWDMAQRMSDETVSGRSETAAAAEFTDNPVDYDAATEEANRRIIATFLNLGFNAGQIETALDLYAAPDYAQHNPGVGDGTQAVLDMMAGGNAPSLCYDIQFVLTQNDLVWVYSKVTSGDTVLAVVDMMRVRDGVMVEHWDVMQVVPDDADMPHDNGMF